MKQELHLHLYGCLTAKDVFDLGKSVWEKRRNALAWYAQEYEKAWDRKPQWEWYWTHEDGFEKLKKDYEIKTHVNFSQFQASFNLLIALFPLNPEEDSIVRYILERYKHSDLEYAEFRLPFGMSFSKDEEKISSFLTMLANLAFEYESQFVPRFAISLPRDNVSMEFQYTCIKNWQKRFPQLSSAIVAIDFCYFEDSSPSTKKEFFTKVHKDNELNPENALKILYHVGEMFTDIETSILWVRDAHRFGAHRLGHAIALGIDPDEFSYSEERKFSIRKLQNTVMQELKEGGAIIESCPRSNLYLGGIRDLRNHPLPRFLKAGLNVVISSDDPGIFDTTLKSEVDFAKRFLTYY